MSRHVGRRCAPWGRGARITVAGAVAAGAVVLGVVGVAMPYANATSPYPTLPVSPSATSPATPAPTSWRWVTAGNEHTCAIAMDQTLWCWGYDGFGQLGDGTTAYRRTAPVQVGTDHWIDVSAGNYHTCAVRTDQTLWCWGENYWGQVGDGSFTDRHSPVQVGTATNWRRVEAGDYHTCGIQSSRTVPVSLWCWGDNRSGQVGDGTTVNRGAPVPLGAGWTWVNAGTDHTCATRSDGRLACWGSNQFGQLGDAALPKTQTTPAVVLGDTKWSTVSAGTWDTCAISDGDDYAAKGLLWCWGDNAEGKAGVNSSASTVPPTQVVNAKNKWYTAYAGHSHTCAVDYSYTLWCWGNGGRGEVGDGTMTLRNSSPVKVGTQWELGIKSIAVGNTHTCGIRWGSADQTFCWGDNYWGQLGNGTTSRAASPTPMP